MLEMTYFCAELVQLIVRWTDSELEVQRYGIKKNSLTVVSIMLEDEMWMTQREKPPQTAEVGFWKLCYLSYRFLNFEISLVRFVDNWYSTFDQVLHTPSCCSCCLL